MFFSNEQNQPQSTQRAQSFSRCAPSVLSVFSVVSQFRNPQSTIRNGISLIEVLISMFVLLFGLMGVAAIFPVGNFYVVEGEKFDLGAGIAQNAFEEMRARGMLRTEVWHYSDPQGDLNGFSATGGGPPLLVMQPNTTGGTANPNAGTYNITGAPGPGHAFVIDPLGTAADATLSHVDVFPRFTDDAGDVFRDNPWVNPSVGLSIPGRRWPVRRLTVLDATGLMSGPVAETIFRLRDDLAVDQPDESDQPSRQLWDVDNSTGTSILLRRQYKGDYSWLATIVPVTQQGLTALQPASDDYGQVSCDVSVVVFRKRDLTPSGESERLIQAELLQGGEMVIYSLLSDAAGKEEVDAAVEDIRPGNWIALTGVNQTTGDFVMKWYRVLSLDTETEFLPLPSSGSDVWQRRAMLIGADWPAPPTAIVNGAIPNLRCILLPGAISVTTKPLRMENTSLWNLQ